MHWMQLLDEIRAQAQMGLNYGDGNAYDQARYTRLLELTAQAYAELCQIPPDIPLQRFQAELGHITPKVGVNGALFNSQGQILLVQRRDDSCWSLPAGWCDMNETPYQALEREWREELSLEISAGPIVEIFTRLPGDFGSPHTSYHLVMRCRLLAGTPQLQESELLDWGWFEPSAELDWHLDHQLFAETALKHWQRSPQT